MAGCKDCISYGVCNEHWLGTGDMPNLCSGEYICEQFKDRNRFVELPCKVGDTVYYPWAYDENKGIAFNKIESIKIYVGRIPLVLVEDWESDMPIPTAFYPEDFGKTVFLTREEAEKKLEE